jgi:hypothetical protein
LKSAPTTDNLYTKSRDFSTAPLSLAVRDSHLFFQEIGILGSALTLSIYFLAFFSSIVYRLPLWPDLYDSNMKVLESLKGSGVNSSLIGNFLKMK